MVGTDREASIQSTGPSAFIQGASQLCSRDLQCLKPDANQTEKMAEQFLPFIKICENVSFFAHLLKKFSKKCLYGTKHFLGVGSMAEGGSAGSMAEGKGCGQHG
jgi:hypothetical protein